MLILAGSVQGCQEPKSAINPLSNCYSLSSNCRSEAVLGPSVVVFTVFFSVDDAVYLHNTAGEGHKLIPRVIMGRVSSKVEGGDTDISYDSESLVSRIQTGQPITPCW